MAKFREEIVGLDSNFIRLELPSISTCSPKDIALSFLFMALLLFNYQEFSSVSYPGKLCSTHIFNSLFSLSKDVCQKCMHHDMCHFFDI